MALDLDVSRPLRGIDGRRDLVRAIVSAHSGDESDWIEWKSDPDLHAKSGCFHVARVILGMANRPVGAAARTCGGFGYVAIGVEPGNLNGVEMPDPSQWIDRVEVYLKGETGPSWEWMIVPFDGADVLVVTVDPPQDGDPPWPLRKELDSYRSGTLFVRKAGKTEPALAEDVDALGRRLRAGGGQLPQLFVEVIGDVPVPWLAVAEARKNVDTWVQCERDRLVDEAQAVDAERTKPGATHDLGLAGGSLLGEPANIQNVVADMQNALRLGAFAPYQDVPDNRTLEEYTAELDEWATELAEHAVGDLLHRYCGAGHGLVHLRVANNSTQYLPGVEIRVHIDFERAKGFEDVPEGDHMPKAPWPFGKMKPATDGRASMLSGILSPIVPNSWDYSPRYMRDTNLEDGSIKVTLDAGDLRPTAAHDGDDFFIFLPVRPPDGHLHATWTATVRDRDGILEGRLTIPVQPDPIDVGEILSTDM